jgi:spore maturation protein CgeB
MLTGTADNLCEYFEIGSEIASFGQMSQLILLARRYLDDEPERQRVAAAGCARTLREHTYVHRFTSLFERMGLAHEPATTILSRPPSSPIFHEV